MTGWKAHPAERLSPAQKHKYLDRLLGEDPTSAEVVGMWRDRHPRDQLPVDLNDIDLALSADDGDGLHNVCLPLLDWVDHELWRARMRADLGSLTGVLDAIDICRQHNRMQPKWLTHWVVNLLGALGSLDNTEAAISIRRVFNQEAARLRTSQRARMVHRVYRRFDKVDVLVGKLSRIGRMDLPETVIETATAEGIDLNPARMTQDAAFEIAAFLLKDTWAAGSPETMRAAYKQAKSEVRLVLETKDLTERQKEYLGWDLEHVRPATLEALGLQPIRI